MRFQAWGGFHSIKKQGPPPWGINQVGILPLAFVVVCVMVRVVNKGGWEDGWKLRNSRLHRHDNV